MTGEASTAATGGFVFELKAQGEEENAHEFHKGLPVAQQLQVGRVVSKIDSDGAVFAGSFGSLPHVSPPGHQVSSVVETRWGGTRCNIKTIVKGSGRYY